MELMVHLTPMVSNVTHNKNYGGSYANTVNKTITVSEQKFCFIVTLLNQSDPIYMTYQLRLLVPVRNVIII